VLASLSGRSGLSAETKGLTAIWFLFCTETDERLI